MSCAKCRAAAASSSISFCTLPLVSMASVRFSGTSDLALEDRDLLRAAIFEDCKIVSGQPADNRAILVGHVDEDVYQLHVHVERGRPAPPPLPGPAASARTKPAQRRRGACRCQLSLMRRLRGVDHQRLRETARPAPTLRHPTKVSFFQMGTVCLRVSISQRQASNAAERCALGHDDQHTGLADLEPAEPVNHRYLAHAESLARLSAELPHLFQPPSLRRPRSPGAVSGVRANGCAQFRRTPLPRRLRRCLAAATILSASIGSRVSATTIAWSSALSSEAIRWTRSPRRRRAAASPLHRHRAESWQPRHTRHSRPPQCRATLSGARCGKRRAQIARAAHPP